MVIDHRVHVVNPLRCLRLRLPPLRPFARQPTLTILAAVAGMAAGYLAWLAAVCLVITATPVNWWVAS